MYYVDMIEKKFYSVRITGELGAIYFCAYVSTLKNLKRIHAIFEIAKPYSQSKYYLIEFKCACRNQTLKL